MKTFPSFIFGAVLALSARAQDGAPSAADIAGRLSAQQQDGSAFIRARMETQGATLQLQIKQRRTRSTTEVVYQILWPKERAGEAVLLRKSGNGPASGALFTPPDTTRSLDASQMKERIFGSGLAYADIVENFFAWEHQSLVGTETVDRTSCQVLESKPGKGDRSIYGTVRTWVDTRRMVPLRVEKYLPSGQLARRIDTTRVVTDEGHAIPANLTVHDSQKGLSTDVDGSRIKHGVNYDDNEFTAEGLRQTAAPRGRAE